MILSAQTIRQLRPVQPFHERTVKNGMTFGLSGAGYDIRIAEDVELHPGHFRLASTVERFEIPSDVVAMVHDKSSWARQGLSLFNTVLEPGWHGYLTLELASMHPAGVYGGPILTIPAGSPIAQIVFMRLDEATEAPYRGKYQDQRAGPQAAIFTPDLCGND